MLVSFRYQKKSCKVDVELPLTYEKLITAVTVKRAILCECVEHVWIGSGETAADRE